MELFKNVSFIAKLWLTSCPLPCSQAVYDAKMSMYHNNGRASKSTPEEERFYKNNFYLSFSYETFAVEEHVETLIYDTGNFLAQIGGNLGLFLGFSCFSTLVAIIHYLGKLKICH